MTTYVIDVRTVTPHFPGIGRYVANLAPALAAQLEVSERLLVLHAPEASERLGSLAGAVGKTAGNNNFTVFYRPADAAAAAAA